MSNILRSYRRGLARNRMLKAGFHKINKNKKGGSYFSNKWRNHLDIYKEEN